MPIRVEKRDGRFVDFDGDKIKRALEKAFIEVGTLGEDIDLNGLVGAVTDVIESTLKSKEQSTMSVEEIQDIVEEVLMNSGNTKVAKAYILYREHKKQQRAKDCQSDGSPFSLPDLEAYITALSQDLGRVDVQQVMEDISQKLYKGMPGREYQEAILTSAKERIDEHYHYSQLSSRMVVHSLYSDILGTDYDGSFEDMMRIIEEKYKESFINYVNKGIELNMLSPELREFDLEYLASKLVPDRDNLFMYLGMQTLTDRYLLRDRTEERSIFELPQWFWMRVAMGVALAESNNREEWAEKFYDIISEMRFVPSTPTLFNSGTIHSQLSSCYLNTVDDDLDHIFKVYQDCAHLSKWSGGVGTDWTRVRATGSVIHGTNGTSQGLVPFLKIFNDTALAVNQGGKRKGAFCAYLENWHLDFEQFLELKKNTGDERRRTHDINTASWISDLFMKRVQNDEEWTLMCPSEAVKLRDSYGEEFNKNYEEYEKLAEEGKIRSKKVKAVDLWRKMLTMLFETGHPWLCLPGDSIVAVADGRNGVAIKDLAEEGKEFLVYSGRARYTEAGFKQSQERAWIPDIKKATAYKTGVKEIIEVHLDDGSILRSTMDHLVALRDGGYKKAEDLEQGDRLAAFNTIQAKPNSRHIYGSNSNSSHPGNRQANLIWEYHFGRREKGFVIDHIENNGNDAISNLQKLTVEEHNKKSGKERHPRRIDISTEELILHGKNVLKKDSNFYSSSWNTYADNSEIQLPKVKAMRTRFGSWAKFKSLVKENHTVLKITRTGQFEEVYDITVEDNHNFYVLTSYDEGFKNSSGVLVHNCFKDPSNIRNPQSHVGMIHNSNLCTEITLNNSNNETAVCNLGSINLPKHVNSTEFYSIDKRKIEETIKIAVRMLDNVIDINYYPTFEAETSNKRHRPIGLGLMGWQDYLYTTSIPFDSDENITAAGFVQELISYYAISASSELAETRGSYSTFERSRWSEGLLPIDTYTIHAKTHGRANNTVQFLNHNSWDTLREKVKTQGIRNSNIMAIAPTACQEGTNKIRTEKGVKSIYEILEENEIDWKEVERIGSQKWIPLRPFNVETMEGLEESDKIWFNGEQEVFEIEFEDGSVYSYTGNHKLLVKDFSGLVWKEVKDLLESDDILST